jgi:nucleotide-binding universal stress UspA family protein
VFQNVFGKETSYQKRRNAMIPRIKKILYATDLSQNSAYVMRYALNSAQQHDASIVILHVLEKLPKTMQKLISLHLHPEHIETLYKEHIDLVMKRIQRRAEVFCQKELDNDPELQKRITSIEVCEGAPAELILQKADELGCDIIMMGTHGKGLIQETFLGSTTRKVIKESRIPICIVPLPKGNIDLSFQWGEDIDE